MTLELPKLLSVQSTNQLFNVAKQLGQKTTDIGACVDILLKSLSTIEKLSESSDLLSARDGLLDTLQSLRNGAVKVPNFIEFSCNFVAYSLFKTYNHCSFFNNCKY